jgi:acyl-CoA reductase-like NAD-dependent aldehyde dehydrogenase
MNWNSLIQLPVAGSGSTRASRQRDVDIAYQPAAHAAASWRSATPAQRQAALLSLANVLEANKERLMRAENATTVNLTHRSGRRNCGPRSTDSGSPRA